MRGNGQLGARGSFGGVTTDTAHACHTIRGRFVWGTRVLKWRFLSDSFQRCRGALRHQSECCPTDVYEEKKTHCEDVNCHVICEYTDEYLCPETATVEV